MVVQIATAEEMRNLGQTIGQKLAIGDVVALTGPLGAGKTELTKGIAAQDRKSTRLNSSH